MADLFTMITGESAGSSPYEWGSISVESGNDFAPSTEQAYAGSYSYKASFGGSNDGAYAFKAFTDASVVYISFYVFMSSGLKFPYGDSLAYIAYIFDSDSGNVVIGLRVRDSNSDGVPDSWRVTGLDLTTTDASTNFSLSAWHKIEMYFEAHASAGIARVWVDGSLILEDTGVADAYTPDNLRIGVSGGIFRSGDAIYFDNISGADSMPSGASIVPLVRHYQGMDMI